MKKILLLPLCVLTAVSLPGCGATKAPEPSGDRVPVNTGKPLTINNAAFQGSNPDIKFVFLNYRKGQNTMALFGKNKQNKKPAEKEEKTAIDWESSRIQQIEVSEARAWSVVKLLALLVLALAAALIAMMPLHRSVPFVIKVDKSTGMAELLSIANAKDIPVDEMQDKYWLSQYVLSRESYDWRTLENDYIKTRELSMPDVFEIYAKQFGQGKDSLETKFKDRKRIVVELKSVVPNGNGIATVRFTRRLLNNEQGGAEEAKNAWAATIGYTYEPNFKAEEANRLVNPFGFKVTAYRVDSELTGDGGAHAEEKKEEGGK